MSIAGIIATTKIDILTYNFEADTGALDVATKVDATLMQN
jgi:hypothetical protein